MRELIRYILREHVFLISEMPKKLSTSNFIEKSQDIHGHKYDYSKSIYVNNSTPIEIICQNHGSFLQKPLDHMRGRGCPKCVGKGKNTNDFIDAAIKKHGEKYDYSEVNYKNNKTKVKIKCPTHGWFEQSPNQHLRGEGCQKCGVDSTSQKNRTSLSDFIKKSENIHSNRYDYSNVNYVNNKTPISVICPIHGEFNQRPGDHLSGVGCPKCAGREKNIDDFIELAIKKHGDKYDYSKVNFINRITPVIIICPVHGEFSQKPSNHYGGSGCPKCSGQGRTKEEYLDLAKQIHNNQYDYSLVNFKKATDKIKIICSKHGLFTQRANTHLDGQGCPKCAIEKNTEHKRRSTKEIISLAQKTHGNKYDYSLVDYKRPHEKVSIICPKHGVFSQTMHAHINGNGCPTCNESRGEKLVDEILKSNGVDFHRQYKFVDCTNKAKGRFCRKLPFDFYIPKLNTCIEYDGEQHYTPVDAFGGEKSFQKTLKSDSIKNQYCEEKGIKLIRIPYTMSPEEIETYLLMELGLTD